MYWIVPHIVNALPPRFSRRESPKSDKRRWPESKHMLLLMHFYTLFFRQCHWMFLQESSVFVLPILFVPFLDALQMGSTIVFKFSIVFAFFFLWLDRLLSCTNIRLKYVLACVLVLLLLWQFVFCMMSAVSRQPLLLHTILYVVCIWATKVVSPLMINEVK